MSGYRQRRQSLVEAAVRLRPDVVITDISMPGMSGIESLRSLKASGVVTKVIFRPCIPIQSLPTRRCAAARRASSSSNLRLRS
jgi:CheY-like chemotaxis protein